MEDVVVQSVENCGCPACTRNRAKEETAKVAAEPPEADYPEPPIKPRLRVLSCPDGNFFLVLDRVHPDMLADGANIRDISDSFNDKLPKCGGLMVFRDEVELEAYYPYG